MHVMWYEYKMVPEAFDSILNALQYVKGTPEINICLNHQTYIETPIQDTPADMFAEILDHPIFKIANVTIKTDAEPFYNIGDWRREQYNQTEGYTMWGESDCIYPYDTFYILENLQINHPHILTFSSRKMWDETWKEVEFIGLDKYSYVDCDQTCPQEMLHHDRNIMTQARLDEINDAQGDINIIQLNRVKFDGAMLTLSAGLPAPFIAPGQQITHEDFVAQQYFQHLNIPQYHIKNRLKGENKYHPLKRTNTNQKNPAGNRSDLVFNKIAQASQLAMTTFLREKLI